MMTSMLDNPLLQILTIHWTDFLNQSRTLSEYLLKVGAFNFILAIPNLSQVITYTKINANDPNKVE